MQTFVPEDYFLTLQCAPKVPSITDPFAEDAKHALAQARQSVRDASAGMTEKGKKAKHEYYPSNCLQNVESSSLGSACRATNLESQDNSEPPGPVGPSSLSPARRALHSNVKTEDDDTDHFVAVSMPGESSGIPCPRSLAPAGVCTITAEVARKIFRAKKERPRCKKDGLASRLRADYGIFSKAVRDIWRLGTWVHATWPFWTHDDMAKHLKKILCVACRNTDLKSINQACHACKSKLGKGRD